MTDSEEILNEDVVKETFVIGIGASAGGLTAINDLFDNIRESKHFSYIILQHLSPDYKSLMGELLSKHTEMQVLEAREEMEIEPNTVYLLPSKKVMTIQNGRLQLQEKLKSRLPNHVIDVFFESLAKDKGNKAIGVILSGTGTDGVKGIKAIKEKGGTVVVQDPLSAEFDGMPNSAIATGCADLILPPEMMADELLEYVKAPPLLKSLQSLNHQDEFVLLDILDMIYKATGNDFSNYKRPTIYRRLNKRMMEKGYSRLGDYHNYLKEDAAELKSISREFLINVTKFFRDEEAFYALQTKVLPLLLKSKPNGDTIKLWVVACSTGEEAYSIGMLIMEFLKKENRTDLQIKIFATDLSNDVIEIASRGLYHASSVQDISSERRTQFFIQENNHYRVIPDLRKMVVFAKHNVLKDPPFSKIDLLSCRNMMIYMNVNLQKSVLQKFHFALNEDGYLFLGPSENISVLKDFMKDIDKKWKLYKCITKAKSGSHEPFLNPVEQSSTASFSGTISTKTKNGLSYLAEIFKETLLEEFHYAGIFIDKDFDVKQAVGHFKDFISFPEDHFNLNLLKMVPPDLAMALGTTIRKAIKNDEKVTLNRVNVRFGKQARSINLIVKPYLTQKTYLQPFIFVILSENKVEKKINTSKRVQSGEANTSEKIQELERELNETRENLQALVEEADTANEELQSSNEEIISANEELQSTNEELQSLNEELHTVNAEHQLKIKELIELNDDMTNYFNNSEVGQILVDKKMVIKKFSPVATKQVNLIHSDIGRSITDISTNFVNLDFINDIKKVIQTEKAIQKEILIENGNRFLMRITPYVRQDKLRDGVVISFINISEVKKLSSLVEGIFNASASAITAQRPVLGNNKGIVDFEFITANTTVEKIFGINEDALIGQTMRQIFPGFTDEEMGKLVKVMETDQPTKFEYFHPDTSVWMEISAVKMIDGIVTTFTDITESKESYKQLSLVADELTYANAQLEQSNLDLLQFASVASHDLKEPLRKVQAYGNLLKEKIKDKLVEKEENYLDKIINSSSRMQSLIEDVLTLSKLSNNCLPYEEVDLNRIIKNIKEDLEVVIKEKSVQIVHSKLPKILAIPGQIHQLFQNLISNAIKFNDSSGPIISISSQPVNRETSLKYHIRAHQFIRLDVEDNGIGFDPQYADKIFGLFQRLSNNQYEGTGIGLAICKKIVDNHHGFIGVDSKPGLGSCFTIILPHQPASHSN